MDIKVLPYNIEDVPAMAAIWNEVVAAGNAFPQESELTDGEAREFFASQSSCGVAWTDGEIVGMYILHPNNVGRCGHICNASYAVASKCRSMGVGEALVLDCIDTARTIGFKILQFNAVVKTNLAARQLYKKLGFTPLGEIPGGFRMPDGSFETIIPHYISL